jgi:hypothetical protein
VCGELLTSVENRKRHTQAVEGRDRAHQLSRSNYEFWNLSQSRISVMWSPDGTGKHGCHIAGGLAFLRRLRRGMILGRVVRYATRINRSPRLTTGYLISPAKEFCRTPEKRLRYDSWFRTHLSLHKNAPHFRRPQRLCMSFQYQSSTDFIINTSGI